MGKIERSERRVKGNTQPSPKKQDSQSIRWCFTDWLINYKSIEEAKIKFRAFFKDYCKYFIYGIETCPKTKEKHFQGYFELRDGNRKRLTELKKLLGDKIHFEKAKGNKESNIDYCSKEGDYTILEEKRINGYTAEDLGLIEEKDLYYWQKEIIEIIKKGGKKDRNIYWYWSECGNIGKTEFTKYLMFHHNADFVQGKKSDITCSIAGKDGKKKAKETYIFGYPRTYEDYVSYDALECVKDGLIFSNKYESGSQLYPKPVVIVFSNFKPVVKSLSLDRWVIKELTNKDCSKTPVLNDENNDIELVDKFAINFD